MKRNENNEIVAAVERERERESSTLINKIEKNKGITLVALVITIIILLILAGISIRIIASDNGLFNKAEQAKEEYENKQELEMSILNSYSEQIELGGDTADELVKKIEEGEENTFAGKEVTYTKYKDKDGNIQDKWIIVYIGKNTDTAADVADDMPTDENHIYLLPKYSVAAIAPQTSKVTIDNINNIIEAKIDTTSGYSSTPAFRDSMRDASNWSAYAVGTGSVAHGAMSVAQYNMCVGWGTISVLTAQEAYWLDDPTWSNAIARVDDVGTRVGNGLQYWWDTLGVRPFVMVGTNCRLTSDGRIISNIL